MSFLSRLFRNFNKLAWKCKKKYIMHNHQSFFFKLILKSIEGKTKLQRGFIHGTGHTFFFFFRNIFPGTSRTARQAGGPNCPLLPDLASLCPDSGAAARAGSSCSSLTSSSRFWGERRLSQFNPSNSPLALPVLPLLSIHCSNTHKIQEFFKCRRFFFNLIRDKNLIYVFIKVHTYLSVCVPVFYI